MNIQLEDIPYYFQELVREHWDIFIFGSIGFASLAVGIYIHSKPNQSEPEVVISTDNQSQIQTILVDISGAVEKPGIYQLKANARVAEAINKAGGVNKEADSDWVSRNLNLAAKLTDGQKIYIPEYNAENTTREESGEESPNLININTATEAELKKLVGVGEVRSREIIEGRPYSSLSDVVNRKILSEKIIEDNKDVLLKF